MQTSEDLTRPDESHPRNYDGVVPPPTPTTLAERALTAHHEAQATQRAHVLKRMAADDCVLKELVETVLGADAEVNGRLAIVGHFRFSYRLIALEPRLFAWWKCDRCNDYGDWRQITTVADLGAVEDEYRKHKRILCRPWARQR